MQVITNEQVAAALTTKDAIDVMRLAFDSYGRSGAMQRRVRIDEGPTKLSMMGAIIPGLNAVGAKIYTTINGKFTFVINLFSADDGALLAVMEGDSMTEFRTAAVTALAADSLARHNAKTLAIFGTGVQARAHVPALLAVRNFSKVLVVGIHGADEFAAEMEKEYGIPCGVSTSDEAVATADVIVTATRSPTPLFDGAKVKAGAFVAAIGSSKPDTREVDDNLVRRASHVVVEWIDQAKLEAGDLLLCDRESFDWDKVIELDKIVRRVDPLRRSEDEIILYKAIGVGLEDVALAEFVYRRLQN